MPLLGQFVLLRPTGIFPAMEHWPHSRTAGHKDNAPVERLQVLPGGSIRYSGQRYVAEQDAQKSLTAAELNPGIDAILPRCCRGCGHAKATGSKVRLSSRRLFEPGAHRAHRWEPYVPPSVRNAPESYWKRERPKLVKGVVKGLEVDLQVTSEAKSAWKQKRSQRKKRPFKHRNKRSSLNQDKAPTSKPVVKKEIKSELEL
ncbi:hypothetical protein FRC06_007794 [Ceratobasidium sp. 370]|nr:hypothetical protein FRC06_007794 [Ceratobasidium sp. 370]